MLFLVFVLLGYTRWVSLSLIRFCLAVLRVIYVRLKAFDVLATIAAIVEL